jgi:glycosyltransferase involved in cell wall biosynthesis
VLQHALGVIVHSLHAKQLAATWYGASAAKSWSVIPLLRQPNASMDRQAARQALGLQPDEFMVCSFGLMGCTKLNHRLLQSWLDAAKTRKIKCRLVFVGEEQAGEYGLQIRQAIQASGMEHSIQITGRADPALYGQYLMAADLAVQLRTNSRGETSAAVLDCLNYGLPTIANAHGALAELPATGVWLLADDFTNAALTEAIDVLWSDEQQRHVLGLRGQVCTLSQHAPGVCADQYRLALERAYAATSMQSNTVAQARNPVKKTEPLNAQGIQTAQGLAQKMQPLRPSRQLLVDVSATCLEDLQTGIQRVVRALVWSLIQAPPAGVRIEPVYLTCETGVWHYRYARKWTCQALGIAGGWMPDDPVDYCDGDVLLMADFTSGMAVAASETGVFEALKDCGVSIHFFVYDLLPLQMPQYFPPGQFGYLQWLQSLTAVADSAICISRSVAEDLQSWQLSLGPNRCTELAIDWFHLGADLVNSIPSRGLASNANQILAALQMAPSFLMVGTIEPRKGYLQTLQTFTQLWQAGVNINLVIVGREGWVGLRDDQRQTIPQIVSTLRTHPELGKRLLWLEDVSDEYLSLIYAKCVCLIAASEGEGFGLPLIEAAKLALPILARDIPVFREVAGDHAFYFSGLQAEDLSRALQAWLALQSENKHPSPLPISALTWEQSTKRVLEILHFE